MRLRNLKDKEIVIEECLYLEKDPFKNKGKWSHLFNNNNEIHLEIGMGKGDFIYEMAKSYPNINFIGIEKYTGVLARALKKYPNPLPNLKVINLDALNLNEVFDREISTIYLNFSDPWPKKRTIKRRLTSDVFLSIYDSIFKSNKKIIMKTDNIDLFQYSLVSLSEYGYILKNVNLDLTNSDIPNIKTEYEKRFIEKGYKINYLVAEKKN